MKPIITFCLLALAVSQLTIKAQKAIRVAEDSLVYGKFKYPCITVTIPEVGYERTEKNWIKELQTGTRSKVVVDNGELTIFGAIIKDISVNPMNIYSRLMNQDSALQLRVSFELKKDVYIDRAAGDAELLAAREYLKEFAKNQYINLIREEVMAEEKTLRELNNELRSLQNANSRMKKSIESNKTLIKEMQENIVFQNNELTRVNGELVTQNDLLTAMEEGSAKEEKASLVKELERSKKKILNAVESSENKITRANSEINVAERDIPRNDSQQETARTKINQQEAIVKRFNDKLNTVKAW